MEIAELKRIVRAFVNDPSELDVRQGRLVAQIQDELIDAELNVSPDTGELVVTEGGTAFAPRAWLLRRVAKLDLLAERILAHTPEMPAFVLPSGSLRSDLASTSDDKDVDVPDVVASLEQRIAAPLQASTSVLYLTSDAGEGKTTLIGEVARRQAQRCKERRASSLLVPIPLGGKTFLRFDDVVIGTLSNRYRFNRYYFDGFIELVRIGAIVPAFDGFEEMFVEGHSGEAVSALGNLIDLLDSSGSIVVAARKAFFEFTSFRTQARLFDSIGDRSASFSRLRIDRWGKQQFLTYAGLRGYPDAESLYDIFSKRLPSGHPMLSRAFLVKRLIDLAEEATSAEDLAADLGTEPQDYFFKFVETIVDREARLKWLDKTGDASHPLLTLNEHHELLAAIAREMWQSSTNALRLDVVDVIVDLFAESKGRDPAFVRQVRERVKNHSLLSNRGNLLEFDHDEFRRFYLGEALGRALAEGQQADLISLLSADRLPADTCDQAVNFIDRSSASRRKCVDLVLSVAKTSSALSFARENSGALIVRLLTGQYLAGDVITVHSVSFPVDALVGRSLSAVQFSQCRFEATALLGSTFRKVDFIKCEFERLDVAASDSLAGASLSDCRINSIRFTDESERHLYGPAEILRELAQRSATLLSPDTPLPAEDANPSDERIEFVEKFLRIFLRATQVNEDAVRVRLGRHGATFVDDILPDLIRANVVQPVEYRGRGVPQGRYKLSIPMERIQQALFDSKGNFDVFIARVTGAYEPQR